MDSAGRPLSVVDGRTVLRTILVSSILGAFASFILTPNATALAFLTFVASAALMVWAAQHVARLIHF